MWSSLPTGLQVTMLHAAQSAHSKHKGQLVHLGFLGEAQYSACIFSELRKEFSAAGDRAAVPSVLSGSFQGVPQPRPGLGHGSLFIGKMSVLSLNTKVKNQAGYAAVLPFAERLHQCPSCSCGQKGTGAPGEVDTRLWTRVEPRDSHLKPPKSWSPLSWILVEE